MKKILCLLLFIGCLCLTGCDNSRNDEEINELGNLINGTNN